MERWTREVREEGKYEVKNLMGGTEFSGCIAKRNRKEGSGSVRDGRKGG